MTNTNTLNYTLMGFKDLNDFGGTVTGFIYFKIIFIISLFIGATVFYAEQSNAFIGDWIFSPSKMMIAIWMMLFTDWFSAVYPALLAGKFETNRAKRIIPIMIANTLLLSSLFYAETHIICELDSELLVGSFYVFRIWCAAYIFAVALVSAVSNAGRNGLIKMQVVDFVTKYVDAQKKKFEEEK